MSSQSGRLDHIVSSGPPEAPTDLSFPSGTRTEGAAAKERMGPTIGVPMSLEVPSAGQVLAEGAVGPLGPVRVPSEARPIDQAVVREGSGRPSVGCVRPDPPTDRAVAEATGAAAGVSVRPDAAPVDQAVAKKAFYQHGLVTLDQLRELGVTRKAVRVRIERGQWVKAETGIIRISGCPITWESNLLAHVLAAGEGAMASHRSAAALWGLEGFGRTGKPELVLPGSRRLRRTSAVVHRSSDLDRVRLARRDGIPTTPVGRTLLDLGAVTGRKRTLLAVDDARRRKLIDWEQLLHVLVTHARRGRDGVGTLRSILDEHFGDLAKTDSGFERVFLVRLAESGLPKPVLQHEVQIRGRTYRIDLAYPEQMLAIELDGGVHMRRDVRQRDYIRQNALITAGWRVLRFTWEQYRNDWAGIVREVRAALASQRSLP